MSTGTLIVGACQAGVQLAVSLRERGYTDPISLVGAEPHLPYQRPPLSKSVLAGEADVDSLRLRNREFYDVHKIDLVLGERVTDVDLARGQATTDGDRVLRFDKLALTTGSRVRRLVVPGANLEGVLYLRDVVDAGNLATALSQARQVVVVGGGFIGLEAAAVARKLGKEVTVVEATARLVSRAVAPMVSEFLAAAHERRGTRVLLGRGVEAIEGRDGVVTGLRLEGGEHLPAQLVVVGVGVVPRTELAEGMGLAVAGGVLVDRFARTSHPHVVAAGDCTVSEHAMSPDVRVRLESVQNAQDQARVAAATILGLEEPYTAVPWFWSDQADLKLQIAGLSAGHDHVVIRGRIEDERFTALYYRCGRLIASDSINQSPDYLAVRKVLASGQTIPADQAADTSKPLRELVHPLVVALPA